MGVQAVQLHVVGGETSLDLVKLGLQVLMDPEGVCRISPVIMLKSDDYSVRVTDLVQSVSKKSFTQQSYITDYRQ
jgi:hypothetical protein